MVVEYRPQGLAHKPRLHGHAVAYKLEVELKVVLVQLRAVRCEVVGLAGLLRFVEGRLGEVD